MDGIDQLNLLSPPAGMPCAPRIAPLEPPYSADVAAALSCIHPYDSSREPLKLFRTMVRSLRLCDPMFAFARFMLGRNTATAASYISTHRSVANYPVSEQFQSPPARPRVALGGARTLPRALLTLPRAGLLSGRRAG
jgi:hypothetical protein